MVYMVVQGRRRFSLGGSLLEAAGGKEEEGVNERERVCGGIYIVGK